MAFKAKLKFSGKEYDVLHCSYSLRRDVDAKGRPTSGVYGGEINVEVEANKDTSVIEGMVNNQFKPLNGSLTIMKQDEESSMKEIKFSDAYVVRFSEAMYAQGSAPMMTNFTISAKKIEMGSAVHENEWPS
jgi:hypothetical protein